MNRDSKQAYNKAVSDLEQSKAQLLDTLAKYDPAIFRDLLTTIHELDRLSKLENDSKSNAIYSLAAHGLYDIMVALCRKRVHGSEEVPETYTKPRQKKVWITKFQFVIGVASFGYVVLKIADWLLHKVQ